MIYAFLSDEAFAVTEAQSSVMSVSDIQKYKLGTLDDNLLNYFSSHAIITDPVGSAKALNRESRLVVDDYTKVGLSTVAATGRMFLNFDKSKIVDTATSEYLFINALTVDVENDSSTTIERKIQKRAALFNIIETIFFARNTNSTVKVVSDIERIFSNAPEDTYKGYVSGSLNLSSTLSSGVYRCIPSSDRTIIDSSDDLKFYNFCVFKFRYGTEENEKVDIKVWLEVNDFIANYPYSTITDIIYPCKPEWILDPTSYGSEMRAVISSADYKDSVLDAAVTSRDHSGLVVYKSRYVHNTVSSDAKMGFVVMYKGAVPSAEAMRKMIREKLLSEKNKITGSSLATEEQWKKVLPDLFVDSGFYIFPCYYQISEFGNNTIEQNISNYKELYDRTRRFFDVTEFSDEELFQNMEIIQAPGHGMYMVVFPVSLTTNREISLLKIHPTYQPLDSVGSVTEFVVTSDTIFVDKSYYYKNTLNSYEFIPLVQGTDYNLGDNISQKFPDMDVYERLYILERDDWNTMTSATKTFAWSIAHCIAACIDVTINPVDAGFTVEELGSGVKKEFYSFVSNSTEFHVMTLSGAEGIFTKTSGD